MRNFSQALDYGVLYAQLESVSSSGIMRIILGTLLLNSSDLPQIYILSLLESSKVPTRLIYLDQGKHRRYYFFYSLAIASVKERLICKQLNSFLIRIKIASNLIYVRSLYYVNNNRWKIFCIK